MNQCLNKYAINKQTKRTRKKYTDSKNKETQCMHGHHIVYMNANMLTRMGQHRLDICMVWTVG